MPWLSRESLKWALQELDQWSGQNLPTKRPKQVLYRLLLLRQLGVNVEEWVSLSTADFSRHCKEYLLVSEGDLASRTGGNECYFVPLINRYQRASGGSDWAVGTMWTRRDVWVRDGILLNTGSQAEGFQFKFTADYVSIFKEMIGENLIPVLPLAIFLFRCRNFDIGIDASSDLQSKELKDLFFDEFNLRKDGLSELFK